MVDHPRRPVMSCHLEEGPMPGYRACRRLRFRQFLSAFLLPLCLGLLGSARADQPVPMPPLLIRREQTALGLLAAEARLHQAEWETVYAVTRMYCTLVYSRVQLRFVNQSFDEQTLTILSRLKKQLEDRKLRKLRGYDKWV